MAKTRYYGIKFPIQIKNYRTLLDLNTTKAEMVKSQLIHLIFTPEGQKLRDPLFGTNLIKYIFDTNDELLWDDIVMEVKDKVKAFIPNCEVNNMTATPVDNERGVLITVKYSVKEDDGETKYYELQQVI